MIVNFNPNMSNNRQQKMAFKKLPDGIDKNTRVAEKFVTFIDKYSKDLTPDDKLQLIELEKKVKDPGIKSYLTEALELLGLKSKQ